MTVSAATRRQVIERDGSRCQWCGRPVDVKSGWYSLQHRRARGMGGSRRKSTDLPANLLLVCGTGTTACHGEMESHPGYARDRGFRLGSYADPETEPYTDHYGNEWTLDNDGGKTRSAAVTTK